MLRTWRSESGYRGANLKTVTARLAATLPLLALIIGLSQSVLPKPPAIDVRVHQLMTNTGSKGLALAVIDEGKVIYVQADGSRNAKGDPLQTNTVMYGASLTKTVVAYATLQLVDAGNIALDLPVLQGGHNGTTANPLVCIEAHKRCVLILSNDIRSEAGFGVLVRFILGETGVPYD